MKNTTMLIYSNNIFIVNGSTTEGYAGANNNYFGEGKTNLFYDFVPLKEFIINNLQKNENNISDIFINCN